LASSDHFFGSSRGQPVLQLLPELLNELLQPLVGRLVGDAGSQTACTLDFALQFVRIFDLIHRSSPLY
jgi:hypothetical protein